MLLHPTPVLLPGKSHGQRSLGGCSPWGHKSRTRLSDFPFTFHFHTLEKEMATHSSVLAWRIPGTRGAWWAAVYGVAHSWTQLKRLSSSSREAWRAVIHGIAKSRTRLSDFPFTFHFHALEKEIATHSSVLAWRIPGKAEPGGLPSMESVAQSQTRLK